MEEIKPFEFNFNLGRIAREPKLTDFPASILLGKAGIPPAILKPADAMGLPITMQGTEGSCGGYSIEYGFVLFLYRALIASGVDPATAQYHALSPRSAYAIEKFIDGTGLNTVGTTIEAVAKAFVQWGICLETLFPSTDTLLPNNVYGDYTQMSPQAKADAATRAQTGYSYFFTGKSPSFDNIKTWIAEYGFIILEVEVGTEWYTSQYGKVNPIGQTSWFAQDILPLVPPKIATSGHFICVPCYDEINLLFPNSWSEQWGNNGWGQMQENYVPFITNGLVFEQIPPSVKQVLQSQPQITPAQLSIAQQILADIESALGLIQQEVASL